MTMQEDHKNAEIVQPVSKPFFPLMEQTVKAARTHIKNVDGLDVSEQSMQDAIIKGLESAGYEVWR